jgi:hypothetical protein
VREALSHKRYYVRRTALRYLIQLNDPQDRARLLSFATDASADVRLAWAQLMEEYQWPEATGALARLLEDQRDYSNDPGYLQGPSWSEYKVARAAARALGAFETVPEEVVDALIQRVVKGSRDPFARSAAVAALTNKEHAKINKLLNAALGANGLKGARDHRPIAQAAAWTLFDRAVDKKDVALTPATLDRIAEESTAVSGPLIMTAGVLGGPTAKVLGRTLKKSKHDTRLELLRVAAIISGHSAELTLSAREQTLAKLQADTALEDLDPAERAKIEAWSRGLKPSNDVQAFTAWAVGTVFKLPVPETGDDLRAFKMPERIGVFNLRSITPAREEFFGADDGT